MKSFITTIFIAFISSNTFSQNINTPENFSDPYFRTAVEEFMGVELRGEFTAAEASIKDGTLECSGNFTIRGNIKDMKGIELFPALTVLNCSYNALTNLDVSHNTALEYLICFDNQLTSLDVSKNTALKSLQCGYNQLTSLDVSGTTALTELFCNNNQFTSLDVTKNTALILLNCVYNQLTRLDVSKNTALESLQCDYNRLTSLDVSGTTALTELFCYDNQLTSLDVSKNTALKKLECCYNQLTSLDVSGTIALTEFWCYNNQLTNLDVSKNTALESLHCGYNQLTSLSSLVTNKGLGPGDSVDVRYNYIGCVDSDAAMSDIQILTERIRLPFFKVNRLQFGFAYLPQKECETSVLDWSLHTHSLLKLTGTAFHAK